MRRALHFGAAAAAVAIGAITEWVPSAGSAPPPVYFARPSRDEPGCYLYRGLDRWDQLARWSLRDYVGVGPPFGIPATPPAGCSAAAPVYENATVAGSRVCIALGTAANAAQATGLAASIPDTEPPAGIRLEFGDGDLTSCGTPRSLVIELRCDPAADPVLGLDPVDAFGDCSTDYNGTYTFKWSTPLACPTYNATTPCPPAPPPPPPQPSPPLPGGDWPRHPTGPKWGPPTYDMGRSTIMMPCNTSGWFDSELAARYGIADFDWSTGRDIWANSHPMDNAAVLIEQANRVKAVDSRTHVWVYRNLVKALSWYADVGEKLADPAFAGWFLHFDPNKTAHASTPCTAGKCSSLYHSQDQTPEHLVGRNECRAPCDCGSVPCGEYLWDHRNASLRAWLVEQHVMGPLGLGHPNVSGFYFDDYWLNSGEGWSGGPAGLPARTAKDVNLSNCETGPSEIQADCLLDMGLTVDDVLALNAGWRETTAAAMRAVVAGGGWVWQMFSSGNALPRGAKGPGCTASLSAACLESSTQQTRMCFHGLTLNDTHAPGSLVDPDGDVARFLLTRGPHAYLGTGWVGCEPDDGADGGGHNQTYARPAAFDRDYGEPVGLCAADPDRPGRFVRRWSRAIVSHDCNTGESAVRML